jgi:hypothetical protein
LEKEARALTVKLKTARRARDAATDLERKVEIVRRRQLIVRRILDAIVYFMCGQYVVFIRRLAVSDDVRPIDPDGLAHIVEVAGRLNEQHPKRSVYLAADLTTSVHIGDLVQIQAESPLGCRVRILEVKEGKINRILAEKLAAGDSPEDLREGLGDKVARQAERMLRQQRRLQGFSHFVRAGQGIDPRTNRMLRRTPDRPPTLGYQPELRALIEKAAQAGQAIMRVDDCLVLGAARAETLPEPRLCSAWHSLFHYNHSEMTCLLSTARAQEELDLLKKEPVIDLVENTYSTTWGCPVFTWGTLDRVCDLLSGRVCVYAIFDAAAFMKRAARLGMRMEWVTGRRAEVLKQTGGTTWIPGSPRASAIRVEMAGAAPFELFSGFLARIFLELAKPDTLLKGLLDLGRTCVKPKKR